jgi:hypothetical protein
MQSQVKVLAPVMTCDVTVPNSSKKVPMVMVPVPDSKTLMAIPLSTINNMTEVKDEQQAMDLLNWNDDGIGTLDGCDLRFRINQLGCLELVDSDDGDSNSNKKAPNKKIKKISPGSSLLRDGPDNRRPPPKVNTKRAQNISNISNSVLLEKLIPKKQIDELKSKVENWSVQDVKSFVDSLPGCSGVGDLFESQQICGKSLLHLDQKDLVEIVNIKLGPAIKIYNVISLIKS